jgi:hypothetical protein
MILADGSESIGLLADHRSDDMNCKDCLIPINSAAVVRSAVSQHTEPGYKHD